MVKIRENGIERDLRNALALPLALTGPALTPLPVSGPTLRVGRGALRFVFAPRSAMHVVPAASCRLCD